MTRNGANNAQTNAETHQVDLSEKKAFLKQTVTAIMLEGEEAEEEAEEEEQDEEEEVEEEGEEEDEDEGEEAAEPKKAKRKTKRTDFQLSPALFEFMGGEQTLMAKGDVRKRAERSP